MEEITCTPSSLKLVCLNGNSMSGCGVIDVAITNPNGAKVKEICFRNNYTASIAIKGRVTGGDGSYVTLVESFQLMKSPHYANESQNHFKIDLTQHRKVSTDTDLENFAVLRLILRQPSSIWDNFGIDDIRLFRSSYEVGYAMEEDEKTSHGTDHSFGSVVESMEELKRQIASLRDHYVEYDPAPFDVGGCYDINLLSYT